MTLPYNAPIRRYQNWLRDERGLSFDSYDALCRWSVSDLDAFWQSIRDYFDLQSPTPHTAARLRHSAQDWPPLAQARLPQTPHPDEGGRFAAIENAVFSWPENVLAQAPWLLYGRTVCCAITDPLGAVPLFETAYAQFDAAGDSLGLYLAWAGAVDAIADAMQDFRPLDAWLVRLERLIETHPQFPNSEVEARVLAAALNAMMWRQPMHPSVPRLQERARELLQCRADSAAAARLGSLLLLYEEWFDTDEAQIGRTLDRLAQLDKQLECFPLERILIAHAHIVYHACRCDAGRALAAMDEGLALAERHGIHARDIQLIGVAALACLGAGDIKKADKLAQRMKDLMRHGTHRLDSIVYEHLQAWRAALSGDFPSALRGEERVIQINRELGACMPNMFARSNLAQYQLASGDPDAARAELSGAELPPALQGGFLASFDRFLVIGGLALAGGDRAGASQAVTQFMGLVRRSGNVMGLGTMPTLLAQICDHALQHNLHPDTARAIIQRRRLPPPRDLPATEHWPYPVKLRTLGRFTVLVDDKPLSRAPAHRKPLELLQALVALGGREVDEGKLAETFWPEADGDAARQNLKINVHRLRQLLPKGAIIWSQGKLSLDARQWWVDLWALERELGRLDQATQTDARESGSPAAPIWSLYQGEFLSRNPAPWALAARERLRGRTIRLVAGVAESLRVHNPAAAVTLYEKAIEIDPLRESLYQGLMRCHQRLQQRAEGLHVYRRCRDTLQRELGLAPAPATETLHQTLKTGQ